MTVKDLKNRMQLIEDQGFGESEVQIWDPDAEELSPVTGMVYGNGKTVELFTDEP